MSAYFEIDWSASTVVPRGLHSSATDGSLEPVFPLSIQLWVRMIESDSRPTSGQQTIWWYGDKNAPQVLIALVFLNSDKRLRLRSGSAYTDPPITNDLTSTNPITMDEWHLVTIIVEYSGGTLTHTMYVDGQATAYASDNTVSEKGCGVRVVERLISRAA